MVGRQHDATAVSLSLADKQGGESGPDTHNGWAGDQGDDLHSVTSSCVCDTNIYAVLTNYPTSFLQASLCGVNVSSESTFCC